MEYFRVEKAGKHTLRPALSSDNYQDIAGLIYDSDPYIYPYWFDKDRCAGIRTLAKLFTTPGNLYACANISVLVENRSQKPIGVVVAANRHSKLNYDMNDFMINDRAGRAILQSVMANVELARMAQSNELEITNVCIAERYRGQGIGKWMLRNFLARMGDLGYHRFMLTCLKKNITARELYGRLGFQVTSETEAFANPKIQPPPKALRMEYTMMN